MTISEFPHRYLTTDRRRALKAAVSACEICARPFGKEGVHPVVDHDHKTDVIRGVICRTCNIQLGYVESARAEPTHAQRSYLERAGSLVPPKVTRPRKERQETVGINLRVSPDLRQHLKTQAERQGRSLTGQIDYILRQHAEREGWTL